MTEYIKMTDAITTTWMILRGMGYAAEDNPDMVKTVSAVFDTAPAADVVERPRWIPVTERLPGDDQRVLAHYGFDRGDGYLGMMFMQVLDYFARDPRPHFQHEGTNGMKVTHWMPLPEPPEGAP